MRVQFLVTHTCVLCQHDAAYRIQCATCGCLFAICTRCYRYQVTCSPECRAERRRALNRAADLQYRRDPDVRRQRARQSHDYRVSLAERQFEGDHDSPKLASLQDVEPHAASSDLPPTPTTCTTTSTLTRCALCGRVYRGFAPLPRRGRRRGNGRVRREPRPPRAPPSPRREA